MAKPAPQLPFWLPLVSSFTSNQSLGTLLGMPARRVAVLRSNYGISSFDVERYGHADTGWWYLVGAIDDAQLASMISLHTGCEITPALIGIIRFDLSNKPNLKPRVKLSTSVIGLIGKHSSNCIARGWNVSIQAIEAYRLLSPEVQAVSTTDAANVMGWDQEHIELFKSHNNAQIARITSLPIGEVRAMRSMLSVSAPAGRTAWHVVTETELSQFTDEELATKFGGPTADYAAQRLSRELLNESIAKQIIAQCCLPQSMTHYYLKMPTRRISRLVSVSVFFLNKQRSSLGIPPYSPMKRELDALLSTCPDTEIAEVFHIAPATVKSRRDRLGKPPHKRAKRPAGESA